MALPYTQSPVGSLLEMLGQGIPALVQGHRERSMQDAAFALKQREAEAQLTNESLKQQLLQNDVNAIPLKNARDSYGFAEHVDPLGSVILQRPTLKAAGVDLPDGYVPPDKLAAIQRQKLLNQFLDGMGGGQGTQNAPAPQDQGPQQGPSTLGAQIPPAKDQPATSGGGFGDLKLTPPELFRFLQSGQFPTSTAQEDALRETSKKNADLTFNREQGVLPEKESQFVQDAMGYMSQLKDVRNLLNDQRVQKGGKSGMQLERFKYHWGIGNSAPYDQIIPASDLGKQPVLSQLAGGIRNAKVRAEIGQHLASSDQSPIAMSQRIDNIVKYYPYMIYSRYTSRGVNIPDAVAQGVGFKTGADLKAYGEQMDNDKPAIVGPQAGKPQAQMSAGQDPLISKYASQFGLSYEQAAQRAAASGYGK
jgi:hypothetical protein